MLLYLGEDSMLIIFDQNNNNIDYHYDDVCSSISPSYRLLLTHSQNHDDLVFILQFARHYNEQLQFVEQQGFNFD